jgi:hypothetical protein
MCYRSCTVANRVRNIFFLHYRKNVQVSAVNSFEAFYFTSSIITASMVPPPIRTQLDIKASVANVSSTGKPAQGWLGSLLGLSNTGKSVEDAPVTEAGSDDLVSSELHRVGLPGPLTEQPATASLALQLLL